MDARTAALEWNRLTAEIATAKANNRDPLRKQIDLQSLYFARLNAGERMAAAVLSN